MNSRRLSLILHLEVNIQNEEANDIIDIQVVQLAEMAVSFNSGAIYYKLYEILFSRVHNDYWDTCDELHIHSKSINCCTGNKQFKWYSSSWLTGALGQLFSIWESRPLYAGLAYQIY